MAQYKELHGKFKKTTSLDTLIDEHVGKLGTQKRDKFENELQLEILGETMKNLTEKYVNIDWSGICEDFNLESGDISPEQSFEIDRALGNINEVIHGFIEQNKPQVHIGTATITNAEHNVLMVALDHMYEHLNDMRGDLDDHDDEVTNINRLKDVKSLQELFRL